MNKYIVLFTLLCPRWKPNCMCSPCCVVIGWWHMVDVHWLNCAIICVWKVYLHVCTFSPELHPCPKPVLLIFPSASFLTLLIDWRWRKSQFADNKSGQADNSLSVPLLSWASHFVFAFLLKSFFPLVILVVLGRLCTVIALQPHRNISALQDVKCNWSDWGQTR